MNTIRSTRDLDFTPWDDVFHSLRDWRDVVIYFLLVDRFDNNAEDIPEYDPVSAPQGKDPEQGRLYQGSDRKGIIRRLDYIKGLSENWERN